MWSECIENSKKAILWKDDNSIFDIYNPGKCIEANSQCNVCSRDNLSGIMICIESFCENETFECIKYK